MNKFAIIVAGGSGERMGTSVPKQFLLLNNKPVLWYTITAFLEAFEDLQLIVVLPAQHLEQGSQVILQTFDPARITLQTGGPTRFHSVQLGLSQVPGSAMVFVHDGVRCLVKPDLIRRCYHSALENGNAVPAISAIDSIRIASETGNYPVDRNQVKIIQTPQTFYSDRLKQAFSVGYDPAFTDEATVIEQLGDPIHLVEGDQSNIKITRPVDLLIAANLLSSMGTLS